MKTIIFLVLCLLYVIPSTIQAKTINKIILIGNSKTTVHAVTKHARIPIGKDLSDEEFEAIEGNLKKVHQFNLKKIDFKDGVLTVEIEEKWSFFPVPMITQSGEYYSRGILLYEDNFLGTLGSFATAFAWTNSGFNGLLYFQDESFFTPETGFKLLMLRKSDLSQVERKGNVVHDFETRYDVVMFTPNYLVGNHVIKGGPFYIKKEIYDEPNQPPAFKRDGGGLFFRHHWNKFEVLDVQYKGYITTYNLITMKNSQGKQVIIHEADLKTSFTVGASFINVMPHLYYVNDSSYLYPKLIGGNEGERGYQRASMPIQFNAGVMLQYQQHLYDRFFLSPFYEYNRSKMISPILSGATLNENSAGIGLRYYFKKITIPALILDYARNIEDKSDHFHINIGLSL